MNEPSVKRPKTINAELHIFPNFSAILSQPFDLSQDNKHKAYFYKLTQAPLFGVLLPFQFVPLPTDIIQELGVTNIENSDIVRLRDFQHEFWSELLRSSKDRSMELSPANYLVVPIFKDTID